MVRTCAVVAFFTARMIVAAFDLGTPPPRVGFEPNIPVNREAAPELPPIIVSGLPQDAGTLRR